VKYYLKVYGRELEASSHFLNDSQVDKVKKMMVAEGYNKFIDCLERIEELLNWNKFSSNMFYITKPELQGLKFELYENNHIIKEFTSSDIKIKDRRQERIYYTIPQIDWHNNILVQIEINRGPLYIIEFDSDYQPDIENFLFEVVSFETHNELYDIVENVFYNGIKLQTSELLDKKSYTSSLKIWTMNDIYRDQTTN
jgi:hypothetical protein